MAPILLGDTLTDLKGPKMGRGKRETSLWEQDVRRTQAEGNKSDSVLGLTTMSRFISLMAGTAQELEPSCTSLVAMICWPAHPVHPPQCHAHQSCHGG